MIMGLSLIFLSSLLGKRSASDSIPILNLFYLIGSFFWFWGFYNYVKRKGYPATYTLIGILGLLGLLIMYRREDRGEARNKTIILICNTCKTEKHVTDEDTNERYFICKICGEKNIW